MNKISEKRIENGLAKYYALNNFEVKKQVPFTQKRIDIVLKNETQTWSIEVKINDWRGALRQANLNKIAFDCSYVAIWHKFSHRAINNREAFENLGVGLIIINADFTPQVEFVPPLDKDSINQLAYNYILEKI